MPKLVSVAPSVKCINELRLPATPGATLDIRFSERGWVGDASSAAVVAYQGDRFDPATPFPPPDGGTAT